MYGRAGRSPVPFGGFRPEQREEAERERLRIQQELDARAALQEDNIGSALERNLNSKAFQDMQDMRVGEVVGMGFKEEVAMAALDLSDGDTNAAIELIMSGHFGSLDRVTEQ